MGDETAEAAGLRAEMRALSDSMAKLTATVERHVEKMERLAVLESEHSNAIGAIDRAFSEISKIKAVMEIEREKSALSKSGYDRWIYLVSGFVAAICVFWSVAGYRVNGIIDDQIKAVAEMRQHIHDDRIKTGEDVRALK